MAKALMIQGTGSGAGKSLITAALCRIFRDRGINVAPFKAQNMALNSFITRDGGEIGRAQALQADAARIDPTVDMNPVLLKASGEMGSQVVLRGKAHAHMTAREYYAFRKEAWDVVASSYDRLSRKHDLIIMEGAGSPAEINLADVDIVNMSAAKYAKAPVILVGDIDKGGVFASLFGTVKLLGRDGRRIRAFIINKFRGDPEILGPGLSMIKAETGKPVIGVLPYIQAIGLPEEDGLGLQERSAAVGRYSTSGTVKIVVVRLKYISNFTDFDPLASEPGVEVVYTRDQAAIEHADMVIVPGSKNTVKDLLLLKEQGLDESIKRASAKKIPVMGMCGGYQMLGRKIFDPHGIESRHREVDGIGLLKIETVFQKEKTTCQVEAEINAEFGMRNAECKGNRTLKGYEIHMGTSTGDIGLFRVRRLVPDSAFRIPHSAFVLDGSANGNCWGTYLHGIFDNDSFRRGIINFVRERKGLPRLTSTVKYAGLKERALNRLAETVRENLDMKFIDWVIGL
ncbi:MAG TPA: cobyric acid synthase [Nitrospirota bacterium]|nr:cobyric acid synthase [Nitrospirota bacterium]